MAEDSIQNLQNTDKANSVPKKVSSVLQAGIAPDGSIIVPNKQQDIKSVGVADVDLLLDFGDGNYIIIPNGAIEALTGGSPNVTFADGKSSLGELFKAVGVVNPAKAGSLRIVTDNIDADKPETSDPQIYNEPNIPTPPPAPLAKVSAGNYSSLQNGTGSGSGNGEGEVPDSVNPKIIPPPSVYQVGVKTAATDFNPTNLPSDADPTNTVSLFNAYQYKVTPNSSDNPAGAHDPLGTPDQNTDNASPLKQSQVDVLHGTSGNDTFAHNAQFSPNDTTWSMVILDKISNFSSVSSIEIIDLTGKTLGIPGFKITGDGVASNGLGKWLVTPSAEATGTGMPLILQYTANNGGVPAIDFQLQFKVTGKLGPYTITKGSIESFSWRDAVTFDDYSNAVDSVGNQYKVLPQRGKGVEIFAGDGDDTVSSGAGNDILHGEAGNDTLSGGLADDLLDGGLGADAMSGGQGADTATYENATTGVTATLEAISGVSNTNEAAGDTYQSIENLKGSDYADVLIGNVGVNTLSGGVGNDVLEGRDGADVLDGGADSDTASYEHSTFGVTVSLGTNDPADVNNADKNFGKGSGTAGDADGDVLVSIENLKGGLGSDILTGNSQINTLDGGAGDDVLTGGAGADVLIGGAHGSGGDTASYSTAGAGVVATMTTVFSSGGNVANSGDAAGDTFSGIENLTGSNYADTLIGDNQVNTLTGGALNDILEGMSGGDKLYGGTGRDTASYAHATAGVTATLTVGAFNFGPAITPTNDAAGDVYDSIESLTGSDHNDHLIGDGLDNVINGGDGDDILEGMGGNTDTQVGDTLIGGGGNDTASYEHSSTGVIAALITNFVNGDEVVQTGDAQGDIFTGVENLKGSQFSDTLIGNDEVNVLTGDDGDDILEGGGAADVLTGGNGNDTASYAHATGSVTASLVTTADNLGEALGDTYSSIENLIGGDFDDTLIGNAANNVLTGNKGNDTISGGAGTDLIYGGDGNDNLTDDGVGNAIIDAGAGDDTVTMTSLDTSSDTIFAGDGTDKFVWAGSGQTLSINASTSSATVGSIVASIIGFEQYEAQGTNSFSFAASNRNESITGGASGNDVIDFFYANSAVSIDLSTGVVFGGSGIDVITNFEHVSRATQWDDVITGNSGNNTIYGGWGADILSGGLGNDTVNYAWWESASAVTVSLMDTATNSAMGIQFTGQAYGDVLTGFENLWGSNSNDILYGNGSDNVINGNGGSDILEGMKGADLLQNGTASYANAGRVEAGAATTGVGIGVTATLTATFAVGPTVTQSGDAFGDTYSNVNNLTGSSYADVLIGNSNANTLLGGGGNDLLEGLAGGDLFNGGDGEDTVSYAHSTAGVVVDMDFVNTATNDALNDQFISIENLYGSQSADALYGDNSDNVLNGGVGNVNDILDGRGGFNTASYDIDSAASAISVNMTLGQVTGGLGVDTLTSIQSIIGTKHADTMLGGADNDTFEGMLGNDNLDGGGGNNTVSYAHANGSVNVDLAIVGVGQNTVNAGTDTLTNFQNIWGSASGVGDSLSGDAADNVIEGDLGNDLIDGRGGNDTASYYHASSGVTVNLGTQGVSQNTGITGNDTLVSIENLLGSKYNDTLTASNDVNVIDAGEGNDVIYAVGGGDTFRGGLGSDTVSYAGFATGVTVNINLAGTDTLTGIEKVIGSGHDDTITGDLLDNTIEGGNGNDILSGGGGGVDTVSYASSAAGVTVSLAQITQQNTVGAGLDTISGFLNLIGSAQNDTLTGDGNANVIEGGLGNDVMNGGNGNDTASYANATAGVTVNLSNGAAQNTVGAGTDTLTSFEHLLGSAYNDTLTGTALSNTLDGGAGDDVLIGGGGADALVGGTGNDTASYATSTGNVTANLGNGNGTAGDANGDTFNGIENLTGGSGNDSLTGDAQNNKLVGGLGNDSLSGGDGNDTLDVMQGTDTASGGNGDDIFLVSATNLPTTVSGDGNNAVQGGGGDTLQLFNLGATFNLQTLATKTNSMEVLNVRDSTNTIFTITSLDVRNFVDGGNASQLWIRGDSGDLLNMSLAGGETLQTRTVGGTTDYLVFNASSVQVAQIHWQTA